MEILNVFFNGNFIDVYINVNNTLDKVCRNNNYTSENNFIIRINNKTDLLSKNHLEEALHSIKGDFERYNHIFEELTTFSNSPQECKTHTLRVLIIAMIIVKLNKKSISCKNSHTLYSSILCHDISSSDNNESIHHGSDSCDILKSFSNDFLYYTDEIGFLVKYHCIDDIIAKVCISKEVPTLSKDEKSNLWHLYEILKDADYIDKKAYLQNDFNNTQLRTNAGKFIQLISEKEFILKQIDTNFNFKDMCLTEKEFKYVEECLI